MNVEIKDDFDLDKIAASGQCFRVRRFADGGYRFICRDEVLYIRPAGQDRFAVSCGETDWQDFWTSYFDLEREYRGIRQKELGKNEFADAAMDSGRGIRILRQDPWEMLLTFLISQRKNIPAIEKAVEALCAAWGHPVLTEYETVSSFPSPAELAGVTEEALRDCGLGYRAPYVLDALQRVSGGDLDLAGLSSCEDDELLAQLQSVRGVGKKVANCVALFAYGRMDCVPVDVWINRAIEKDLQGSSPFSLYPGDAGIIQQYIFYYERSVKN